MSDCSTQAMTPKEPPKTCGTCGHFMRDVETKSMGACSVDYFEADGIDVYRAVWGAQMCGHPSDYITRNNTLEQRFHQLEQVALDACKALDAGDWLEADALRERLEALGVVVDG